MNSLPIELIEKEISRWLTPIDEQILRRSNTKFCNIFPYEEITFNDTKIELVHLIKYKMLWNEDTIYNAVINKSLDCAHENGCASNKYAIRYASQFGYLEGLKYFNEKGYPWDTYAAALAARNGHLGCARS